MNQTLRPTMQLSPAETALVAQLRAAGEAAEADRLALAGLPTRRVESYHYTDLKMLLRAVPPLAGENGAFGTSELALADAYRLGIVNGRVLPAARAPESVRVSTVDGAAITLRDDVIVRLNAGLARESLALRIEGAVPQVIHLDRRTEGEAVHAAGSARITLGEGASAVLVETYGGSDAAHLANHASFVTLGRGASLVHVTVDLSGREATHFATHEYALGEEARLRTLAVHAGSRLARTQIFARFAGEGAHADFSGLNLVDQGQHLDITLDVNHAVPHTSSTELFKTVGRGRSRGVFQGRIVVARGAQKTEAKMMMQGLMLEEGAEILAKPELEIYADDVVCGHGATCGDLDHDALFYLMSRGIGRAEAETLLVRAFLGELLDPLADRPELHAALDGVVGAWLDARR